MSARRDPRYGHWQYRKQIRLDDGRTVRIFGVPTKVGLPDTKAGAEHAERQHLARVLKTGEVTQTPPPPKEVPKVSDFVPTYLDASRLHNKPSSIASKDAALRNHIVPAIGHLRLDQVTYAVIEDLKLELARKRARNGGESEETLSPKSINNYLTILRRMLVIARKRGLIATVPEIDWLKVQAQEFDFLDFEESNRLLKAVDEEWRTMVLVALRTGMRMGELIALRWQDVDGTAGRLRVRRTYSRGAFGTTKSRRGFRAVPLADRVARELDALSRRPSVRCRRRLTNPAGSPSRRFRSRPSNAEGAEPTTPTARRLRGLGAVGVTTITASLCS